MPLSILGWEGYDDPLVIEPYVSNGGEALRVDPHISDFAAANRALDEAATWDIVNINSPFVRDFLHARGRIHELDAARFKALNVGTASAAFRDLQQWGFGPKGEAIGVCQRCGPFNFVVNTDAISAKAAADQGFGLASEQRYSGRYGILAYDDFNVLHIAIACGIDPFEPMSDAQMATFAAMADRWFSGAGVVSADHLLLNRALVTGEIDFYLSGGTYTASSARREGHSQIRAITPRHGPTRYGHMQNRGGIAFVEVNAVLANAPRAQEAGNFLTYLLRPDIAVRAALANKSANPVVQMRDPKVFAQFTPADLDAMQWETLEEDLGRCAQYRIAPDYARLHASLVAARTRAGWSDV